ncbi:hypothetical protein ACLOJK_040411 [Asimina triloba]
MGVAMLMTGGGDCWRGHDLSLAAVGSRWMRDGFGTQVGRDLAWDVMGWASCRDRTDGRIGDAVEQTNAADGSKVRKTLPLELGFGLLLWFARWGRLFAGICDARKIPCCPIASEAAGIWGRLELPCFAFAAGGFEFERDWMILLPNQLAVRLLETPSCLLMDVKFVAG